LRNHETTAERDEALKTIARDTVLSERLMAPLEQYVKFAAQYDCPTNAAYPCWRRSVLLGDQIELSLHGLNSVLASHEHDHKTKERLVVGTAQVIFEPGDGRVHLALSHHPPEWILDADEIGDRLDRRALVQVTGHTHKYRVVETRAGLWLRAGSLQPPRDEDPWEPHFSVIEISVTDTQFDLAVFPWVWNKTEFKSSDPRRISRPLPTATMPDIQKRNVERRFAIRRLLVHLALLSSGEILEAVIESRLPSLSGSLTDAPGTLAAQAVQSAEQAGRLFELWSQMAARRNATMDNPFHD
jgi:hypothetical protein